MDAAFTSSSLECFRLRGVRQKPSRKLLGRGSYGFVEEYTYRELRCAGKKLMPVLREGVNKEQEQALLKNAVKECGILSTLKHPNIVQFLGVHFEEGDPIPILIMEYVPYTLSGFLDAHKQEVIPPEITYGILVDVAQALCYLHGGVPIVTHRDLSANNILLTVDLRAKVSDLGTARILDVSVREKIKRCKEMTKCPGTQAYMPPEACTEIPDYNENIDCYSYGVLMLHVLNREWPTPVDSIRNELNQVVVLTDLDRRQAHIEKIDANHPLKGLILKCLDHKDGRPSAKKILEKVEVVQKQCCKAEPNRMALLIQQRLDSEKEAQLKEHVFHLQLELEKQRAQIRTEMEQQVARLSDELENRKHLYSEEVKKTAAVMEALNSEKERLKTLLDIQTVDLEAMKERVHSVTETLNKKKEEINSVEKRLHNIQEQKDSQIRELLLKKEEEISAIKLDAEHKLSAFQEQRDREIAEVLSKKAEEIDTMKKDIEEKLQNYQKQKDDEVAKKEREIYVYEERLRKKEEIIMASIKRDTERAQKAHEALHQSQSEQGTVLEYLRSGTQVGIHLQFITMVYIVNQCLLLVYARHNTLM